MDMRREELGMNREGKEKERERDRDTEREIKRADLISQCVQEF